MRRTDLVGIGAPRTRGVKAVARATLRGYANSVALVLLLAASAAGCGGRDSGDRLTARNVAGPRVVRFQYRAAERQILIAARDPAGQVIGVALTGPIVLAADGACDLGGRRNGQTSRFKVPARALRPGRYDFTVRLTASLCKARTSVREATIGVALTVAPDGSASATDQGGRKLS